VSESSFCESESHCVYILANRRNAALYIGVPSNLPGRIRQQKNGVVEGFTKRYRAHDLVWFEVHDAMESAITSEKALKAWNRLWEIQLIENNNPYWRDLYSEICD
jgi:putative endonuclease